jgi:hypothetical protein
MQTFTRMRALVANSMACAALAGLTVWGHPDAALAQTAPRTISPEVLRQIEEIERRACGE